MGWLTTCSMTATYEYEGFIIKKTDLEKLVELGQSPPADKEVELGPVTHEPLKFEKYFAGEGTDWDAHGNWRTKEAYAAAVRNINAQADNFAKELNAAGYIFVYSWKPIDAGTSYSGRVV